jgi:hypothetical protein
MLRIQAGSKKVVTTFLLDTGERKALQAIADEEGLEVSKILRLCVHAFISYRKKRGAHPLFPIRATDYAAAIGQATHKPARGRNRPIIKDLRGGGGGAPQSNAAA